jgi:hypothetical protein
LGEREREREKERERERERSEKVRRGTECGVERDWEIKKEGEG